MQNAGDRFSGSIANSRRVGLESTTAKSQVWPVFGQFPLAQASLNNLIAGRGSVDHVRNPSVPLNQGKISQPAA